MFGFGTPKTTCAPELGQLFAGACRDTKKAWSLTRISSMLKQEHLESLRNVMQSGNAAEIGGFLVNMMNNPYASLAVSTGFSDQRAISLANSFITAFGEPFVAQRLEGQLVDLCGMRDAMCEWVEAGTTPLNAGKKSDIGRITALLDPGHRSFVAAGFASPIQFSILALSLES